MSLIKFFLTLKGSSYSGNYGHAGRPGHRGGSVPSKYPQSVSSYLNGKRLSSQDSKELENFISDKKTTSPQLFRVQTEDPDLYNGQVFSFNTPTSTTSTNLLEKDAGSIGIKYSDDSLFIIDNPKSGLDVDYTKTSGLIVPAANEKETIVSGQAKYKVNKIETVEHPGRSGKLKVYRLEEL